jgi:hypothetical protein
MTIAYMEPLTRAWRRMKDALFRPFDLTRWLMIGFTAFLAQLMGGGLRFPNSSFTKDLEPSDIFGFPARALDWLGGHPVWLALIVLSLLLLVAVGVLLTWLSSRGTFMFLDNVVRNSAEVGAPWTRYGTLANSLFLWRLCFGLACLGVILVLVAIALVGFARCYGEGLSSLCLILPIIGVTFLFLLFAVAAGYTSLLLDSFVVPLMYRHDLPVLMAWRRFLALLKQHPAPFILYGLLVALLHLIVTTAILMLGCLTCCVGFLVLMIPYVNTVILLPVSYTFRCFSLEFFCQFGDEYSLL